MPRDKDSRRGEKREKRARIYQSEATANRIHNLFQETSFLWPNDITSSKYHFLLAKSDRAFDFTGTSVVSHGGISLDEVMVPFVKIGEKK